jgi:succinate---hydroxymethylglutarate CoA-transferase
VKGLGLDYDSVKHSKLIYASIAGYPHGSSMENTPAFDLTIQAKTGYMHVTGDPEGEPQKVGFAVTDILTGHQVT